jgi:molybdopterin-guanine dinucleotide biosynthesis protein B
MGLSVSAQESSLAVRHGTRRNTPQNSTLFGRNVAIMLGLRITSAGRKRPMPPIVSIVGYSQSGKTTLIERLLPELQRRGRRVATVKHTGGEFDMDRPGKDTWRYAEAGSTAVAILGPQRSAILKRHERDYSFDEVIAAVGRACDLVLLEGWHSGPAPKIEVHRAALGQEMRCKPEELLAVVSEEPIETDCRQFRPDEISSIANLVEQQITDDGDDRTVLEVNGERISLGPFTEDILANTIRGLVSSLKGIGEIKTISVSIRTPDGKDQPS